MAIEQRPRYRRIRSTKWPLTLPMLLVSALPLLGNGQSVGNCTFTGLALGCSESKATLFINNSLPSVQLVRSVNSWSTNETKNPFYALDAMAEGMFAMSQPYNADGTLRFVDAKTTYRRFYAHDISPTEWHLTNLVQVSFQGNPQIRTAKSTDLYFFQDQLLIVDLCMKPQTNMEDHVDTFEEILSLLKQKYPSDKWTNTVQVSDMRYDVREYKWISPTCSITIKGGYDGGSPDSRPTHIESKIRVRATSESILSNALQAVETYREKDRERELKDKHGSF